MFHFFRGEFDKESNEYMNALTVCKRIWNYKGRIGDVPFLISIFYDKAAIYTEVDRTKAKWTKIIFIVQFVSEFLVETVDTIKG